MTYDYTDRLGFAKMPPGYQLLGLDSGHFIWFHEQSDLESCIHWNRWATYKGAWEHHKTTQKDNEQ